MHNIKEYAKTVKNLTAAFHSTFRDYLIILIRYYDTYTMYIPICQFIQFPYQNIM